MGFEKAIITSTRLNYIDPENFLFYIYVKSNKYSYVLGGYRAKSAEFIGKILKVVDVKTLEQISGKYIRVERRGRVIKNIIKDDELNLESCFNCYYNIRTKNPKKTFFYQKVPFDRLDDILKENDHGRPASEYDLEFGFECVKKSIEERENINYE
ncbi:hypothetical protein FACS1894105_04290 [Clostridia bacterium]|nr:hypothetical protein FACS1894105_04290 [Clostridia bacterium]